jgi:hypothetical protein
MTATTNKTKEVSLDELWESAPIRAQTFNPASLAHLVGAIHELPLPGGNQIAQTLFSNRNLELDKLTSSSTLSFNLIDPTSNGELYYERTC